jgi:hypothetical protein
MRWTVAGVLAFVFGLACLGWRDAPPHEGIFLPGTQPQENGIKFDSIEQCRVCHEQTKSRRRDPYSSWQSGVMSLAGKDPVFRAAVAIANQDIEGIGEFCLRCHAPSGWLEGRSSAPDGSALTEDDLRGVSCALCHRLVDPRTPEAARLAKHVPPGPGNAMMVADPSPNLIRGPYGDDKAIQGRAHRVRKSPFLASGHVCGVCHNVSNPTQATDVSTQPPHAFGHVERTYSEWLLSDFSKQGQAGSCQACHYPAVPGGGYPARFSDLRREHFVEHGPPGGSTWVQDATWLLWNGQHMDRQALERSKERARRLLRTAASLELDFPSAETARLRITNLTGHKLPTGYPEGRRMWVNARFVDAEGQVLAEIGRYGEKDDTVFGRPVKAPTLLDPEETRVYECLPAISEAQAQKHGKSPGPSFHFVLNDVIAKDNRIPPKGFNNKAFAEHHCQPVGTDYADGQHWDDVEFPVPEGTARVAVRLMYQSVSWEYIKFLAEEDRTDDWGKRLYDAWTKTGRCPPEVMVEITRKVTGTGK